MNVECVESAFCFSFSVASFVVFAKQNAGMANVQRTREGLELRWEFSGGRKVRELPLSFFWGAAPAAGKQNKWKMNSIHYHDVKSCVVTAWTARLSDPWVKVAAKKYKLRVMRRSYRWQQFLMRNTCNRLGV